MKQNLVVTGLAALVVLNIVLVYLAVQNSQGDADARPDPGTPSTSAPADDSIGSPSPAESGATGATDTTEPADDVVAVLTGMGGGLLVWGPATPCREDAEPVTLHRASEGEEATAFTIDGLAAVRSITVDGSGQATVTGADQSCEPVRMTTEDAGESWSESEGTGWSLPTNLAPAQRRGADSGAVRGPDGPVDTTCAPARVFGFDDTIVRLQCRDNRLVGTWTGGTEWSDLGRPGWADAVHYGSIETAVAVTTDADACPVALRRSIDGGASWRDPFCVTDEADGASGPWGVAADGDGGLVVIAGETFWWSTDGGDTFSEASVGA